MSNKEVGIYLINKSRYKEYKSNDDIIKVLENIIKTIEYNKVEIEKDKIVFTAKTGDQDRMFGQISVKQIKKALQDHDYQIDKNAIMMDHPIMSLGVHDVKIQLHKKVIATLKVHVVRGK